MLEQVNHIEAVKTPPFPTDSPKAKSGSKGGVGNVPDFKSVLEKSLQEQAHTPVSMTKAKDGAPNLQVAKKLTQEPRSEEHTSELQSR